MGVRIFGPSQIILYAGKYGNIILLNYLAYELIITGGMKTLILRIWR